MSRTVAWVDIDEPAGLELLRGFEHRPQLVVRSGSGGAHAYWRLAQAVPPDELEAVNRRLAGAPGGDLASCDRARLMRLPGSWNGKAERPCRIAYLDQAARPVAAGRLVVGREDPAPPPPPPDRATVRRRLAWLADDPVASVPPPIYFRALAGIAVPERGGFVLCPFHDERLPSLMVYATPERGWRCDGGCGLGLDGGPSGRALRGRGAAARPAQERDTRDRGVWRLACRARPYARARRRRRDVHRGRRSLRACRAARARSLGAGDDQLERLRRFCRAARRYEQTPSARRSPTSSPRRRSARARGTSPAERS